MSKVETNNIFPSKGVIVNKELFEQIVNTPFNDEQKEKERLIKLEEQYKKSKNSM